VLSWVYSSSTAAHAPRLGSDALRAGSFAMTPVDMFGNPNRQVQPKRAPRRRGRAPCIGNGVRPTAGRAARARLRLRGP